MGKQTHTDNSWPVKANFLGGGLIETVPLSHARCLYVKEIAMWVLLSKQAALPNPSPPSPTLACILEVVHPSQQN